MVPKELVRSFYPRLRARRRFFDVMSRAATILILLLSIALSLPAQLTRGFISGTVQDTTGAVIPETRVVITNLATGIRSETQTNSVGVYRFVGVEPGTYSIEFSKSGFATARVESVQVGTAQEVVLNQTLSVAAAVEAVQVIETPVGVELSKASATIERKLDGRFVESVPLTAFFRDVNALAYMAPTATRAPGSTGISVSGQRARNNNFMIDGVDNNDLSVTIANARIIPEAVAEYQVQTTSYSAEYGRNSGAQISVITRSGTNELHGSAWNYYRANWMEPVSLLNKRANILQTPRFVQNQAGGSLGGPIVRNRAFFFGLVETNRRREAADARNASPIVIPTPKGFADLRNVPLGPDQTPQSRQAMLDAISFLPEVHPLIPRYDDVRTVRVNGVPIEVGTARIPLANPADFWYVQSRVDYALSSRDNLSYRNHFDKRYQPDVVSNLGFGTRFSGAQTILSQNHALSHTRTFSPRFVNEFRAAYTRRNLDFPERDSRPTVGITGFFTIGGLSNFPQGRIQNTFQWQNVSTFLLGRHSLKAGVDIRRNRLYNRASFDSKGTWTFNSLEDFMNNRAFSLVQAVNEATFDARQTNQYYFFQDDIRLTRDLTINLGIRYEYSGVPFGFFGAANDEIAAVGVPRPVVPDKNNWAPRFGFAYSPSGMSDGFWKRLLGDGQTVFRGGFGVAYDVLFYNILTVNASNYPRVVVARTDPPATHNLFPTLAPKQATVPPLNPLATFVNSPTDTQNPTTHFWSFSIQRQFLRNYIVEVGYTGNRSYHQIRQGQTNPGILTPQQAETVRNTRNAAAIPSLQARRLNPAWGSRVSIEATAKGEYHGMFVRFDRKLAHGLLIGGNYTFSANFSDNDESLAVADIVGSSPPVPQDYFNYRNEWSRSVFDRPHRLAVYYSYEIPWFSNGPLNHVLMRHVFSGWQVSGTTDFQSGQPFTVRTGVDTGGTGDARPHRPMYNPGGAFTKDPVTGNLRTFTTPIDGTGIFITPLTAGGAPLANSWVGGGNLGRNTFRGPGFSSWSASLMKTFSITERWKIQIRSDWINMWNHRNFGNPVATMNSPAFGTNTTDPGGRTMLLSAKIRF